MRIFSMALALGLLATPVSAQLLGGGGIGGGLGQLPSGLTGGLLRGAPGVGLSPAMRSPLASDPLGIPGLVAGSAIPDAGALLQIRRERLRDLVRRNARVLEADPAGNPVRRGEILAVDLTPGDRQTVLAQGFKLLREDSSGTDGPHVEVLQPPDRLPLKRALTALRATAPAASFDYNAIFEPAGAALRRADLPPHQDTLSHPFSGVVLGLVDGGVGTNPAFAGARIEQRGFAGPVAATGHGTAVASLLVGAAPGFSGAAQGASLLAADVYGGSAANGSAEAIAQAIGWLAGRGAKVINISLVGPPNELLRAAITAAQARGVILVAAVGNDGPAAPPLYPASYPGVIAVTGVDARDHVLIEAGRALHLDFAAPGADMAAALPGGGYAAVRGTSFAAPLVAARLAAQRGAPLAGLASEAKPGRAVGRGIVCDTCRSDPRNLRIKN